MKIEFGQCKVDSKTVSCIITFTATLEDIEKDVNGSSNCRCNLVKDTIVNNIATKIAEEYLTKNKMELVNALSKDDIVNAIQLKMIEQFNVSGRN